MEGDIQSLCNAVEWLFAQTENSEAGAIRPSDQAILDTMEREAFNSEERRRVRHLMSREGRVTLEQKLVWLAGTLGP